jgi:sugar phosphate isomerase/epimerase
MYFGMLTLIKTPKLEDCAKLCHDLGLDFIELNNNFPWYQTDAIDPEPYNDMLGDGEIDLPDKFALAKECNCRCVLETKTIQGLTRSVERLHQYLS